MKHRLPLLALLLFLPHFVPCMMAEDNDVGVWTELGLEKSITKKWDVGLDLEYRAQNKSRFSAGLSTSYKPFKFLKLGVGYNFLYTCRPDKRKDKNEGTEGDDEWTVGYNFTPQYWFPRHRFYAEATGSVKFLGWLKVSLRERYQQTRSRARYVTKQKYRTTYVKHLDFDEDWNEIEYIVPEDTYEEESELKPGLTDQVLRSRIKIEYDKKRFPFTPFVSAETHNSVSVGDHMLLQKVRASAGCTYKFRKKHEVSLAYIATFYVYDIEDNEVVRQDEKRHAINVGYKFSF